MNRLQRAAVLAELADQLTAKGSWCGETHMQKAVYMLQELTRQRLGYDFVLYKHGPFSFDLRDELTGLRADGFFKLESRSQPYGPMLVSTPIAQQWKKILSSTVADFLKSIEFVASNLGDKGVTDLEKLGTALYVTVQHHGEVTPEARAKEICQLKPHITLPEATSSVEKIDELRVALNA